MGAPPSEDQMARMLSDPSMLQTMNAALDNPQFIDYMIQSNPQLRNMPNAREIIQSPFMRQMMTNPDMLRNMMSLQRGMMGGQSGGAGSFPAPGATNSTPEDAAASNGGSNNANANANPGANPFGFGQFPGAGGGADLNQMLSMFSGFGGPAGAGAGAGAGATTGENAGAGANPGTGNASPPPANPFAALFGAPPAGGAAPGQEQAPPNPFAANNPFMNPEAMQQMMAMLGGGGGGAAAAAPPDNRPPEERYADQLRQLNDMGFFDFDRNVSALRRSGGSVQGAVEHLLSGN